MPWWPPAPLIVFQGAAASQPSVEGTPAEVKEQNEEPAAPEESKKLNKRERKEARQQKNGKVKKGADNDTAIEQGGRAKKRKRASENGDQSGESNGDQNGQGNGDQASAGKRKKSKGCSEGKTGSLVLFPVCTNV